MDQRVAESINILGTFCGMRDLPTLDQASLYKKVGLDQVDVMVLFGGSILAGADLMARAIKDRLAKYFLIVGGAGHTTDTLRCRVRAEYSSIGTAGLSEAEIFQAYLGQVHGCQADLLETRSTNCGNNITYMLDLLKEQGIPFQTIILCQDATMQRRMDAGFRRCMPDHRPPINFASYAARVTTGPGKDGGLAFAEEIHGMWTVDRYVNLLMGEIPRLADDPAGYGPRGAGYIAHVDLPRQVTQAYETLKKLYGDRTRKADPRYASKE